ncbi:DUF2189 domain-containing protein [Salinibius halmophilus]|uniref:DUF2189 domain-containing protein n=1 Tax=Salinibius halmophilus TaxID=1853216 RepID=UPI000E672547|nr:DUF2189 domain-containing protein [Salinibius halmophilus]
MADTKQTAHQPTELARSIDSYQISARLPFHWLSLAVKDFLKAPLISLAYGIVFALIPAALMYFYNSTGEYIYVAPMVIGFAMIGPVFAVGLYDVAWEMEKGHKPTLSHSLRSMFRNPVGEWGFAFVLMLAMIFWLRIAAVIHAVYPVQANPPLQDLVSFLTLGTFAGGMLTAAVFMISAFTPQIMMERHIDLMTAIVTSAKAVYNNIIPMIVWAGIIGVSIAIGFLTFAIGFVIIMPILAYASWHAYIATIKTKNPRRFE